MNTDQALRQTQGIEADIRHTRAELDATLGALAQRLSPRDLADRGIDYLRHSGAREYAANLGSSVKVEPLPVALVGIGLAWLMASGRRDRAADAADESTLADKWSRSTHAARDGASRLGERARHGADRVRHGYDYLFHEQPLALGAIGLAIGAVLAASAARTDRSIGAAPEPADAPVASEPATAPDRQPSSTAAAY